MNFLFDNPLASMDGGSFLALFVVFIIVTLFALAIARSNLDNTNRLPIPAIPPQPDPFEIAYLRGGFNELARSVLFSLLQKGFVQLENDKQGGRVTAIEARGDLRGLTEQEKLALNWIGRRKEAKEVFDARTGLTVQLEQYGLSYHERLESRQLLTSFELETRAKRYSWIAAFAIAGFGGYKILAAVMAGKYNVIFTALLILIGAGIALAKGSIPRITKLGKVYLERLQLAFEDLKYRSQAPYIVGAAAPAAADAGYAGVNPLLLSVGVFGTGILGGTVFADYNDTFAKQQASSSGGGCGSGCGSGCSSGGGCGSGCGGGCGGCS